MNKSSAASTRLVSINTKNSKDSDNRLNLDGFFRGEESIRMDGFSTASATSTNANRLKIPIMEVLSLWRRRSSTRGICGTLKPGELWMIFYSITIAYTLITT
jgi:hypothetical protein